MATVRDRILAYLRDHPEGVDDDELALALKLKARQQANRCCRQLVLEAIVERRRLRGKIRNFLIGSEIPTSREEPEPAADQPWFWEGNVQAAVVRHLESEGYRIVSAADTASKQQGKDIEAERAGVPMWITVKGYPKGTPRTHPTVQAAHSFKDALFDMILWRGESATADLGLALPDYPRYRNLAARVAWLQPVARFSFIWVMEDSAIEVVRRVR